MTSLPITSTVNPTKGQKIAAVWITTDPVGNAQRIALAAEIDAAIEAAWEEGWDARRDADGE